jgi:hypothetical protein
VSKHERTGVVTIRLWIETADVSGGFRARITLVPDLDANEPETAVAGHPDEIVAIVGRFVHAFAAGGDARVTPSPENRPP